MAKSALWKKGDAVRTRLMGQATVKNMNKGTSDLIPSSWLVVDFLILFRFDHLPHERDFHAAKKLFEPRL